MRIMRHKNVTKVQFEFYALLTVHFGSILENNQPDAQFFFRIYIYSNSLRFKHPRAHRQENHLYQYDIWYMSLYVGDCLVCRFGWNCSFIPGSILVNNQLDAQFFFFCIYLFQFSTCIEHPCARHQKNQLY
jgi:hypothetical protein